MFFFYYNQPYVFQCTLKTAEMGLSFNLGVRYHPEVINIIKHAQTPVVEEFS